jgi:hypothetical protein
MEPPATITEDAIGIKAGKSACRRLATVLGADRSPCSTDDVQPTDF